MMECIPAVLCIMGSPVFVSGVHFIGEKSCKKEAKSKPNKYCIILFTCQHMIEDTLIHSDTHHISTVYIS